MAYAFQSTARALGQNQDDPAQQQANIFQAPAAGQQQSGSAQRSDAVQASDTGGDLSGTAAPTSGVAATVAPAQAGGSSAAQNRVMGANQGKVKSPVADGMQGRLADASSSLQKEADNYTSQASQPYAAPSSQYNDVDSYVKTGAPQTTSWMSDLARGNAGQVDAFAPKTDTSFAFTSPGDAAPAHTPIPEMLQSDAGIRQLMRQGQAQDAEYNTNDAALDTALLRKDQGFNQTRDALINGSNALKDQKNKLLASDNTGETAAAQTARDAAYTGWQGDIKKHLQGDADAITASDSAQSSAFNDAMKRLQAGDTDARKSQINDYLTQMKGNPGYDPKLKAEFDGYVVGDPTRYFDNSGNPTATTGNDFITQDQVGQFGRVGALLGNGGQTPASTGQFAGKSAQDVYKDNFNSQKYSNDLLNFAQGHAAQRAALDASKAKAAADAKAYQDQKAAEAAAAAANTPRPGEGGIGSQGTPASQTQTQLDQLDKQATGGKVTSAANKVAGAAGTSVDQLLNPKSPIKINKPKYF